MRTLTLSRMTAVNPCGALVWRLVNLANMVPGLPASALARFLLLLLMRLAANRRYRGTRLTTQRQLIREAALLRHPAQFGHHLLHLAELLQQLPDVLTRRPTPGGDTATPAEVDHVRMAALLRRHRADDRLDLFVVVVGDLRLGLAKLPAQTGDHLEQLGERAHLLDLLQLI